MSKFLICAVGDDELIPICVHNSLEQALRWIRNTSKELKYVANANYKLIQLPNDSLTVHFVDDKVFID